MAKSDTSWAPEREKWPAGCNPHRDGWVRWYKGRTRFVCGRRTPLNQVEDRWIAKKLEIDGEPTADKYLDKIRTFREVLSEFLDACKYRVDYGRPRPLSVRMLHNYQKQLNHFGEFVGGGVAIDETNKPEIFTAYAKKFDGWKSTGFDSVICRIASLYRFAVKMEYIDRWRPGPIFQRPAKSEIRDQRIQISKSYTHEQVAKLYHSANLTMRCWIGLGVCCGFINTDIAHVPRLCIDLDAGTIDFRRRKQGKIRRVCPLPQRVLEDLKKYSRPEPRKREYSELFFLTVEGQPYSRTGNDQTWNPSDSISRLWARHVIANELPGKTFTGLRTTFFNLAPRGAYDLERKIIMGRAQGDIDLDNYLEDVGLERLRHVVNHVWSPVDLIISKLQVG